jgi:hypothetical protein
MNLTTLRNGAILVGVVALALAAMWLVSSIVSAIVPIAITAVIAFTLGRMSVNVNLLEVVGSGIERLSKRAPAEERAAAKVEKTEQVAMQAASMSQARAVEKLAADKPAPEPDTSRLADEPLETPEIKTEEQLRAESKRIEEEIAKRTAGYDPKAAIEERKKRLGKGE